MGAKSFRPSVNSHFDITQCDPEYTEGSGQASSGETDNERRERGHAATFAI